MSSAMDPVLAVRRKSGNAGSPKGFSFNDNGFSKRLSFVVVVAADGPVGRTYSVNNGGGRDPGFESVLLPMISSDCSFAATPSSALLLLLSSLLAQVGELPKESRMGVFGPSCELTVAALKVGEQRSSAAWSWSGTGLRVSSGRSW